jgi:hypothetical protein
MFCFSWNRSASLLLCLAMPWMVWATAPGTAVVQAGVLLTGTPALPKVPAEESGEPPLRITVEIWGEDELRIFPDHVEWVHGANLYPFRVMLNDVEWFPKRARTFESNAERPFLPESLRLEKADVRVGEARDAVSWRARPDHLEIQFKDGPEGRAPYVITLRDVPSFGELKANPAARKQIAGAVAKSARRPLPNQENAKTTDNPEAAAHEWRHSRLALAFDKHGRKGEPWSASARDYLELVARRPGESLEALLAAGQAAIDAGCDDPLVCCQHGKNLLQANQAAKAEPLLLHANLAFEKSEYPKRCARDAPALLAAVYRRHPDKDKRELAPGLLERAIQETAQAASETFAVGQQRAWLAELEEELGDEPQHLLAGCRSRLAQALVKSPKADPWLQHLLVAGALTGPGHPPLRLHVLCSPPTKETGPLTPRLLSAREHLIEAWRLHPEFPEAAVRLIALTNDIGGAAGEAPRFWFDEAVAVQFDLQEAYQCFLETLRQENGGTHEQMLAFGMECAATKRFDTEVPGVLLRSARLVARDIGTVLPTLAQHRADQEVLTVMQGYERNAEPDSARLKRVRTEHLILCWQMDLIAELRRRLEELRGAPDPEVLKASRMTVQRLQGDIKAPAIDAPEIRPLKTLVAFAGVRAMSLSPDNRTLVTNSGTDAPLSLWDLVSSDEQWIPQPTGDLISELSFSADGKRLLGMQSNTAHPPQEALPGPGVPPARASGTVLMWDMKDHECRELWPVDRYSIYSMAWHPDQRLLVVGMYGGTAVVVDADSGRHLAITDSRGPTVMGLGISPDGKELVAGYNDGAICWYKLPAADELLKADKPLMLEKRDEAKQHEKFVDRLQYSSNGKFLVSGGRLPPVCVWEARTRKPLRRLDGRRPTVSPDGKHVLVTGGQGVKRANVLWNIETGKPIVRLITSTALLDQEGLFSTDGDFVITAGMESYIHVWHVAPFK